tara:strand:+ start:4303 stop:4428 length:126 start_codon:yes stop_codon:yes gene_type:complete
MVYKSDNKARKSFHAELALKTILKKNIGFYQNGIITKGLCF